MVLVIDLHVPFTNIREIENPDVKSTVPPQVEDYILLSFGHSILEFEATLYQKFLQLTDGLIVTCREYKNHLQNMEERGILIASEFIGKKCWTVASKMKP